MKDIIRRVCWLLIIILIITSPYFDQIVRLKGGTFKDVVLRDFSGASFDKVAYDDIGVHPDSITGEKFDELFEYFKKLKIMTKFPQKSAGYGKQMVTFIDNSSDVGVYLHIYYVDDKTISVAGSNIKACAYIVRSPIDWYYIYSLFVE